MKVDLLIPQPIKLGFAPERIKDPELREVFDDALARMIWLTWKPRHLVDQHFERDCLAVAQRIRESQPQSIEETRRAFHARFNNNFRGGDLDRWLPQAYLYLNGTLELRVEVEAE